MATDFKDTFIQTLDSLETAYSDSTRKIIRQIKTEWQKVMKYRSALSSKEDELLTIKEKIMHLDELKSQDDKYLLTAQSKSENLKQSNTQLRGKLRNLRKEEERLAKKCVEQEDYLVKKLSFYEEKWRKRYEENYSKNPKIREKEKAMKEMEEVKEKLFLLNQKLEKYEKDLFQAKCERNKRTSEENKLCPFNTFVVQVAKMYVETKKVLSQCEKTSLEIEEIDKNIENQKLKRQISLSHTDNSNLENSSVMAVDNAENAFDERGTSADSFSKTVRFESYGIKKNVSEHNFQNSQYDSAEIDNKMEICNDNTLEYPRTTNTTTNFRNTKGYSENTTKILYFEPNPIPEENPLKEFEGFRHKSVDFTRVINQASSSRNPENITTSFKIAGETSTSEVQKTFPKEQKARKWLDRLKVFVPSFASASEEVKKCNTEYKQEPSNLVLAHQEPKRIPGLPNDKLRATCQDPKIMNSEILESEHLTGFKSTQKSGPKNFENRSTFTTICGSLQPGIGNTNVCTTISTGQSTSDLKNTSKYFRREDLDTPMDWEATFPTEKIEITKSFDRENREQNALVKTVNAEEKVINSKVGSDRLDSLEKACKLEVSVENNKELKEQSSNIPLHSSIELKEDNPPKEIAKESLGEFQPLFESKAKKEETTIPMKCIDSNGESSIPTEGGDNDYRIKFGNMKVGEGTTQIHEEEQITPKEIIPSADNSKFATQNLSTCATATAEDKQSVNFISSEDPKTDLDPDEEKESNDLTSKNEKDTENLNPTSNVSPIDLMIKSPYPLSVSGVPTPLSMDQTQRSGESNPNTPGARAVENSTMTQEMILSGISPYKADSMSPGFAYAIRNMFEANAANNGNESLKPMSKEFQNNMLAQLSFFNKSPSGNLNLAAIPGSQDDDKNEFLASAFEDYLSDSPPMTKCTEKSMFAFADDSPDKGNDFFPLFAADNGESSKEPKNSGGQFMFNFCGSTDEKSPEETSGFKFMF